MTTSTQIVVGYDASPDARAALAWAIREAASRHLGIRVLYCEPDLAAWDGAAATMSGAPVLATTLQHDAAGMVAEAAALVAGAGVPVETVTSSGSIASSLVEQSRTAVMIVIGSRGHGALSSAILGSRSSGASRGGTRARPTTLPPACTVTIEAGAGTEPRLCTVTATLLP